MIKKISGLILVISLAFAQLGCMSTKQTIKKDSLVKYGVVTAKIGTLANSGYETYFNASAIIDGLQYTDAVEDGYLQALLPRGTHTLESIQIRTGNMLRTFPLNKEFTISAGQVVNLGRLLLVLDKDVASNSKYYTVSIDNTKHMMAYLRTINPEAYSILSPEDFTAEGNFVDDEVITKIRKSFAGQAIKNKHSASPRGQDEYIIYGGMGTMVVYQYSQKTNKLIRFDVLDTGTYDRIVSCDTNERNTSCLSKSETQQKVFRYDGAIISQHDVDGDNRYVQLFYNKKGALTLMADNLLIAKSNDHASTWEVDRRFVVDSVDSSRLMTSTSSNGYYYATSQPASVVFYDRDAATFHALPRFHDLRGIKELVATQRGIYVQSNDSLLMDSSMYFLPNDANAWNKLEIEFNGCDKFRVLDEDVGDHIEMSCDSGSTKIESADAGRTWIKMP